MRERENDRERASDRKRVRERERENNMTIVMIETGKKKKGQLKRVHT